MPPPLFYDLEPGNPVERRREPWAIVDPTSVMLGAVEPVSELPLAELTEIRVAMLSCSLATFSSDCKWWRRSFLYGWACTQHNAGLGERACTCYAPPGRARSREEMRRLGVHWVADDAWLPMHIREGPDRHWGYPLRGEDEMR